jgi:thioredoxin-related protein
MTRLLLFFLLFINACQNAHLVKPNSFKSYTKAATGLSLLSPEQKSYSLDELVSPKGAVLIFWQYSCPCVRRYQQRVNDLYKRFGEKLNFYHISSNTNEPFTEVIAEYNRRDIPLPLLRDQHKLLAQALNVRGTPSAALIDRDGKLLFLGWIDNERDVGERRRDAYLEDAIIAYLKNEPISKPSSPMFGCAIR